MRPPTGRSSRNKGGAASAPEFSEGKGELTSGMGKRCGCDGEWRQPGSEGQNLGLQNTHHP